MKHTIQLSGCHLSEIRRVMVNSVFAVIKPTRTIQMFTDAISALTFRRSVELRRFFDLRSVLGMMIVGRINTDLSSDAGFTSSSASARQKRKSWQA